MFPPKVSAAVCAIVILTVSSSISKAAEDATLRARFLTEAPAAWARFVALAKHSEVEFSEKAIRSGGETELITQSKRSGESVIFTTRYVKWPPTKAGETSGKQDLYGRNSRYAFEIKKTSPELPWFVTYAGTDLAGSAKKFKAHGLDMVSLYPLFVISRFLPEWVQEPGFVLKSVDAVDRPSGQLVALDFDFARPANLSQGGWIRGGVIRLNPDRLWAVEEYHVESVVGKKESIETVSAKLTFLPSSDQLPLVQTCAKEASYSGGSVKVLTDFTRFELTDIPEQEFTLSAFGLPEIGGPIATGFGRLWVYLVGAGIVCVVIAVLIRRRVHAT